MEGPSAAGEDRDMEEPLLSISDGKGGLRALPFIIANEALERIASQGLSPILILYLTGDYGMRATYASNVLFLWSTATNFTPTIGAFLADAHFGRFSMIATGSVLIFLGMVVLWLTAMIPQARPSCDKLSGHCDTPTTPQLLLLYSAFMLMAIGSGGLQSSATAFGADQLYKKSQSNPGIFESYFNWFYTTSSIGVLIGMTCIAYFQEHMGWTVGFGVCAAFMLLSSITFLSASPLYVKFMPSSSWCTGLVQVLVASYKKRRMQLPSSTPTGTYEIYHQKNTSSRLVPTDKLRFLNKACIIVNSEEEPTSDGRASDPWSLCTVDQVEELKVLIRIIPFWSTGILVAAAMNQNSFFVLQLSSMDRHLTSTFEVPAGSFGTVIVISLIIWIVLYDRLILPLASKSRGKPTRLGVKTKMGIGILICAFGLAVSAIVESNRRAMAINEGFSDHPEAVVKMSAFWTLPRYVLFGLVNAFCMLGQIEFFYLELPKTMSSVATSLYGLNLSAGNLAASFIMTSVDNFTKATGVESWVSSNINKGHCDYYYWLLCGLLLANFLYFIACSKSYGPPKGEARDGSNGEAQSNIVY